MHTLHGSADVSGALVGDELVESDKSLGLAARNVEEGGGQDVHALDIADLLGMVAVLRLRAFGDGGAGERAPSEVRAAKVR